MVMNAVFGNWIRDFIALIYPRNCAGCEQTLSKGEKILCTICKYELPKTGHFQNNQNPLIRKFYGRIKMEYAIAYLHFHKQGITQNILHHFKYQNQPEIGQELGEWFGIDLVEAGLVNIWDVVVPVPLHPTKEKRRGYNQSNFFALGIAAALNIPCSTTSVARIRRSETQTNKTREERWDNVEGIFKVINPEGIKDLHVLLVDDVVTTGATLESCGASILSGGAKKLSVATLAIAH